MVYAKKVKAPDNDAFTFARVKFNRSSIIDLHI